MLEIRIIRTGANKREEDNKNDNHRSKSGNTNERNDSYISHISICSSYSNDRNIPVVLRRVPVLNRHISYSFPEAHTQLLQTIKQSQGTQMSAHSQVKVSGLRFRV